MLECKLFADKCNAEYSPFTIAMGLNTNITKNDTFDKWNKLAQLQLRNYQEFS